MISLAIYLSHPDRSRISIMALSHTDRATGRGYHGRLDLLDEAATWKSVRQTITSGSIVRTDVFAVVGAFDDKLFIDAVDTEFCFRCRSKGYLVSRRQATNHDPLNVGSVTRYFSIGPLQIWTYNHPPQRRVTT